MSNVKKACVIYVRATESELPRVNRELEQEGYTVNAVLATAQDLRSIRNDSNDISDALRQCIADADLCVFLIPEEEENDGGIGGGAGFARQMGKRIVVLVGGARAVYPEGFDIADAIIRMASPRLTAVIQGEDTWESPDQTVIPDRPIHHQKCQ